MRIRNLILFCLALSLLIHVSVILSLKSFSENKISTQNEKPLEIVVIEDKKTDSTLDQAKQIVEQDEKQVNDEIDPHTKYLSQFNQKVVKETAADRTGKFSNSAGHGLKSGQKPQRTSKNENTIKPQEKSDEGLRLQKFMPKMDWTAMAQKNSGGDNRDVSRSADYLKDVNKGLQTQLSTREFLYYSYFKRVRGQIQQYWEPAIKDKMEKIMSRGRTIASAQDRVTKLLIVLNKSGVLVGIKILSESGIQDLDDTAIEAFKAAAPFPNPPSGLVEKDGTIKIRWDFVLQA